MDKKFVSLWQLWTVSGKQFQEDGTATANAIVSAAAELVTV